MTKIINSWFVGSDSRKSALTLYLPEKSQEIPLLIFAHGFKGFKDWGHFPLICKKIVESGVAVLAFNFSHNGGTVDNPIDFPDLGAFSKNTYTKELNDISCLLTWIFENKEVYFNRIDLKNISILGHSRGGGICLLASKKFDAIKKVITWASVADFEERLPEETIVLQWEKTRTHTIKNGRTKQDMPMEFGFVEDLRGQNEELNIERAVCDLEKPQLIVHGKEDETVKLNDALRLKTWNPKSKLVTIENCNHTFNGKHPWEKDILPKASQEAIERTIEFLLA